MSEWKGLHVPHLGLTIQRLALQSASVLSASVVKFSGLKRVWQVCGINDTGVDNTSYKNGIRTECGWEGRERDNYADTEA